MVVYIEYVFLDNFFIDMLIIKTAKLLLKKPTEKVRLISASFLGGLSALFLPVLENYAVLKIAYKLVSGSLIALISAKFISVKDFYVYLITFVFLTFALGGAVTGLYYILGIPLYSEFCISFALIPSFVLIKVITAVIKKAKRKVNEEIFSAVLSVNGIKKQFTAFLDSGNTLTFSGKPVIIIAVNMAKEFFNNGPIKIEYLEYKTAMGKEKMPILPFESLSVKTKSESRVLYCGYVGVVKNLDTGSGFNMLLNKEIFGGKEYELKDDIKETV